MAWLDRHPDRSWPRLAAGLLAPAERARLATHARACARCAPQYERATQLQRTLEGGNPFAPVSDELAQFEHAGLAHALASARPQEERVPWARLLTGFLAVGAAAALILVVLRPHPPGRDDVQWRGATAAPARLRAFCGEGGAAMAELVEGGTCAQGSTLAFAVSAPVEKATAVVRLRGAGVTMGSGPLAVTGLPGAERPLDYTPHLSLPPGPATIEVGFGATEKEARAALEGPGERRGVHFTVGPRP